jgi:protein-L-isoaspartate(D-aspartate) O-methyltransferase
MVVDQLAARDVRDPRVLQAMRRVPRHLFVPPDQQDRAYSDSALPIAMGQTISQPYMVGLMAQALDVTPGCRVLEIGTGSGYMTAILATLGAEVFTIDRLPRLSEEAQARLASLGLGRQIRFAVADGTLGWPDEGACDRVLVTARAPAVPPALRAAVAPGGRRVIPVGSPGTQELVRISVDSRGREAEERLCGCAFVPLIGAEGWPGPEELP